MMNIAFWIFAVLFLGVLFVMVYHDEKEKRKTNKKVSILKTVVDRNKLKDTTTTSIDDIVKEVKEIDGSPKNVDLY